MGVAVVVGAGFSGVVATRELLRKGWSVVLVDPGAKPGRGLAYGTSEPWHLLNSAACSMSIDPDDPGHFVRYAGVKGSDFVPRSVYGEYLTRALRDADAIAPGELAVHRGRVVRIFETSATTNAVLLGDGVVISADVVVLAVGNARPDERFPMAASIRRSPGYVRDPWVPGALERLREGPVLLIGTGLTAVDVALTLSRSGKHPHINAVSRHGLLPLAHAQTSPIAVEPPRATTLCGMLREIRTTQGDWRAVMDALRPHWNTLWARLGAADQQRFLRHVARHWEVHRHRMAPQVAAEIARLQAEGILSIGSASSPAEGGSPGEEGSLSEEYAGIVNCTGPGRLIEADPLIRSLMAEGLAHPGPYGLGLDVDEHGALTRPKHRPSTIYTLGPARRGRLWETTAAPEIRAQARALAIHLIPRRSASRGLGALGSCRADSAYPLPG